MPLILIVDDNPQMRATMRRILVSSGYSVIEAGDGREGLELFRSHAPDVVVTDIVMPEKEGIETIIEMSRAASRTKIIAVSGSLAAGGPDFLTMAGRFGADLVLQKPFRAAELQKAVKTLLAPAKTEFAGTR